MSVAAKCVLLGTESTGYKNKELVGVLRKQFRTSVLLMWGRGIIFPFRGQPYITVFQDKETQALKVAEENV